MGVLIRVQNLGGTAPLKFGKAKSVQNSSRFRTTFEEFDRKYLWNGLRYGSQRRYQLQFLMRWTKNRVNFGLLTTKLCLLISTYPTSTVRAFSNNFGVWSHISRERIEISINGNIVYNYGQFHVEAEKLEKFGSQATKFCCLIPNHPSLTLRLLYTYMQSRSGHVTLLRTKFQFFNCSPIDLGRPAALRWALPYISSSCLKRASTPIEDYAQSVLIFSRGATFRTLRGQSSLHQKCCVSPKMHQIYFWPGHCPGPHYRILLGKFSTSIREQWHRQESRGSSSPILQKKNIIIRLNCTKFANLVSLFSGK